MPLYKGSSQPRDQIQVSLIAGRFFTIWATREAPLPQASVYMYHKWDEKTALRIGENNYNWPGINLCNIQTAHAALYQKNKQTVKEWAEDLYRPFSKEDLQIVKRHKMLNIIIWEMQIKTIIKYYLTPVRMAIIKKYTNNKC